MDSPDASRIDERARDLNQVGEFSATLLGTPDFEPQRCTLKVYVDRFEIEELSLKVSYDEVNDIVGGTFEELGDNDVKASKTTGRILLVKYRKESVVRKLAMSWAGAGVDSLDYCEIMLYRAFAANKVRSKNDGAPSYGIIGY